MYWIWLGSFRNLDVHVDAEDTFGRILMLLKTSGQTDFRNTGANPGEAQRSMDLGWCQVDVPETPASI